MINTIFSFQLINQIVSTLIIFSLFAILFNLWTFISNSKKLNNHQNNKEEKRKEELFNEIKKIAKIGSWEWDIENNYITWSKEMFEIFGFEPYSFIPEMETVRKCIHPDEIESFDKNVNRNIYENSEKEYSYETKILMPDKSVKTILVRSKVIFDKKGIQKERIGVVQDITERKAFEEDLRRSEIRFRNSFDYAPIGKGLSKINGVFFNVNKSLCNILGYTEKEIVGKSIIDLIHKEDVEKADKNINDLLKGEINNFQLELRVYNKEEKIIWILLNCSIIRQKDLNESYIINQIQDITSSKESEYLLVEAKLNLENRINERTKELIDTNQILKNEIENRKTAQKELKRREKYFKTMTDAIPQIVWTAEPDGYVDYYNKHWFDYIGLSLEESKGWGWEQAIHTEDLEKCLDSWNYSLSTGDDYYAEYRFKNHSDNTYRWHLARALPLKNEDGKIIKWFGTSTDIDDYKKYEQILLEQAETLQESNIELQRVAYVISHDLQEPLRMITSYIQILLLEEQDNISINSKKYMNYVVEGSKRMKTMIKSLLDYSRINDNKEDLKPVKLNKVLHRITENLSFIINENKAIIKYPDLPEITADPVRMEQIFQNLITNAIKYRKENESPKIDISYEKNDNEWLFKVKDNGVGIEKDYFDNIFVLFKRLHRKDEISGDGVGLSIVKKIIDYYGGKIWLESEIGIGTTFYFTIPFKIKS